jgi:hypothetical protein
MCVPFIIARSSLQSRASSMFLDDSIVYSHIERTNAIEVNHRAGFQKGKCNACTDFQATSLVVESVWGCAELRLDFIRLIRHSSWTVRPCSPVLDFSSETSFPYSSLGTK